MKEEENEGQGQSVEVKVWLVTKEKLVPYMYSSAFTCWVRLQYAWKEEKFSSQMVPCDVWRMDCGGFAWRLDVEAALGLGRWNNCKKPPNRKTKKQRKLYQVMWPTNKFLLLVYIGLADLDTKNQETNDWISNRGFDWCEKWSWDF